MISFSATTNFVSRIEFLRNDRRGVYATVYDEVVAAFKGCTIDHEEVAFLDIYPQNGPHATTGY